MKNSLTLIAFVSALMGLGSAQATHVTYTGIDTNGNANVQVAPVNSSAAETAFKSQLTGVGTENFENNSGGTPQVLTFPGAGVATLTGTSGTVATNTAGLTNGAGRYSVPGGTRYWEVNAGAAGSFDVTFTQDIAAFGFYGIDLGDFGGTLTLQLLDAANAVIDTAIVATAASNVADGSILYFGLIADTGFEFRKVRFVSTVGSGDVFAFDSMTIGSQEQVCRINCPVPEPGSLPLAALALAGLGLTVTRRRI